MQFVAPYHLIGQKDITLHFYRDHMADLRSSGVTDDTIRGAGAYSIRPCDIALFFSPYRGVPVKIQSALCFPYQGGEFARIKLFPALGKMKYSQPPKTSARLYMPFPVGPGDITVAEGEKKTLAAHQAGFNAVRHRRRMVLAFERRADCGFAVNRLERPRGNDHPRLRCFSARRSTASHLCARLRAARARG
jgi:hypothetical protein